MNKIRKKLTEQQYGSIFDGTNKDLSDIKKELHNLSNTMRAAGQSIRRSSQQLSIAAKIMGYNGRPTRKKPAREIDIIKCIFDTEFNVDSAMYAGSLRYTYYTDDIASIYIKYTGTKLHYQYIENGSIRISTADIFLISSSDKHREINIHDEDSVLEFTTFVKNIRKYHWLLFILFDKLLLRGYGMCAVAIYLLCTVISSAVIAAISYAFTKSDIIAFKVITMSPFIGVIVFGVLPITCAIIDLKITKMISSYTLRQHK